MEKNIKPAATQDFKTPTLRFIRPKQRRKLEKEDTGLLLTGTKNPIKKHEVAHVHLQGSLGGISGRRPIKVCLNVHSALILELPTADRKVHIMNLLAKEDQMFIGTKRLELKAQEKLGDEKCFSLPVVKGTGWDVIKSNVQTFFTFEGSIPHRQIRYEDKILKAHFSANESAGWLEKVVTSDQGRQAITLRAFEAGECIYCDRPEAIESSGCRGCGDDTRHQLAMKCLLEKRVNGKKRLLPGKLSSGEVDIVKSPVGKITNVTISAFVLDFIATNDDSIFFILAPEDLVEAFAHYVEDLQGADNYKLRLNAMEKVQRESEREYFDPFIFELIEYSDSHLRPHQAERLAETGHTESDIASDEAKERKDNGVVSEDSTAISIEKPTGRTSSSNTNDVARHGNDDANIQAKTA